MSIIFVAETLGSYDYSGVLCLYDRHFVPKLIFFMLLAFGYAADIALVKRIDLLFSMSGLIEYLLEKHHGLLVRRTRGQVPFQLPNQSPGDSFYFAGCTPCL